MFYVLGVVALLVSGSIALDENEWTERITKSFQDWTKYRSGRDVDDLLSMYHEPMVEMIPEQPAMDRADGGDLYYAIWFLYRQHVTGAPGIFSLTAYKKYFLANGKKPQLRFELQELIYTTGDMALARYLCVETTKDGMKIIWKGVRMFLLQEDNTSIKIRANIYNRD